MLTDVQTLFLGTPLTCARGLPAWHRVSASPRFCSVAALMVWGYWMIDCALPDHVTLHRTCVCNKQANKQTNTGGGTRDVKLRGITSVGGSSRDLHDKGSLNRSVVFKDRVWPICKLGIWNSNDEQYMNKWESGTQGDLTRASSRADGADLRLR